MQALKLCNKLLQEAAELVASRSCGEGWLLQPKIADMPEMEYRCCSA